MPNGGLTPDCVHCKSFRGRPYTEAEPHCVLHKMRLVSPIRAFCSSYIDPEPEGLDWLDKELDREELQKDTLYVWLGGWEVKFFHVPLASIAEYAAWTSEKFADEFEKLADQYRT